MSGFSPRIRGHLSFLTIERSIWNYKLLQYLKRYDGFFVQAGMKVATIEPTLMGYVFFTAMFANYLPPWTHKESILLCILRFNH